MFALVSLLRAGYGQNYMEDFLSFKHKADSIIISLTSEKFFKDNYYFSVERSHPYSGLGSFGKSWGDTTRFKAYKALPRAYDYVYMIRNINETGIQVTIEREPGALRDMMLSAYDHFSFVNGIPMDTSARPKDFLSREKIKALVISDKQPTNFPERIEFNWYDMEKGELVRGIYRYKVISYTTENNKKYMVLYSIDPLTGKVLRKEKEEYGEDFDKKYSPVEH